jgi:hypothetical protein
VDKIGVNFARRNTGFTTQKKQLRRSAAAGLGETRPADDRRPKTAHASVKEVSGTRIYSISANINVLSSLIVD